MANAALIDLVRSRKGLVAMAVAAMLVGVGTVGGVLALSGEDEPKRAVVEKIEPAPREAEVEAPGPEGHAEPGDVADLYAPEGEIGADQ